MSFYLKSLINSKRNIKFRLENSRCIAHKESSRPCKFGFKKNVTREITVYSHDCNYTVDDPKIYCDIRPSQDWFFLNTKHKISFVDIYIFLYIYIYIIYTFQYLEKVIM